MKNSFLTKNSHWLLRVAVSSVFLYHGSAKFMNLEQVSQMLPISYLQTVLVACAQVAGSLLLLVGGLGRGDAADFATRLGAAMNIPVMIGAILLVHLGQWSFVASQTHPMGGMEFQVVLALLMSYIALMGNNIILDTTGEHNKVQASYLPYRTENLILKTFGEL